MIPSHSPLSRRLLAAGLLVVCPFLARAAGYRDASLPVDQRVDDLLTQMTLPEKIGQLQQQVFEPGMDKQLDKILSNIRNGEIGSYILMVEDPKQRNMLQRTAVEESRLGIPLIFGADVIHGHRTIFPIPLGMASMWDPAAIEKAQGIAAQEARAMGLNWVFAPMCDLARDSRWGRVAETGGEDPYLNSLYVAAAVRGFQGTNPADPGKVVSCLKHFAGYSAVTGGRDYNQTDIPNFILRNFHLPPFHAGVQAGALTVMSAFNAIDGIPAAANRFLLTDVLRGEWGFRGFVVSDWEGVMETINWGFVPDAAAAARACLLAGNDMEMMSKLYPTLVEQVAQGLLPESAVDEAVRRVLRVKFEAGLFDHPYVDNEGYAPVIMTPESLAFARSVVSRSTVLLKNDGVLPISPKAKRIALIGPFADETREMIGCWVSQGKVRDVVTLARAFRERLGKDSGLRVVLGCDINGNQPRTKTLTDGRVVIDKSAPPPMGVFDLPAAVKAASEADLVVMALGEPWYWTGENASRARTGLTGRQQELFDTIVAVGKPVVVVLFCGRPLSIPRVVESAAAVVVAWQPGIQAGPGVADVLFGDVSPSGRLTISWPRDSGQLPMFYNRYNTGRPAKEFVGYRDITRDPQYPFGYGLTYTQFSYGKVEVAPGSNGQPAMAKTTITNTGQRQGEEVAQLYIRQMACAEGARPYQELRGFQRLTLKPGQSQEVSFALTDDVLGYVGRDGQWKVDAGDYGIWISPQAGEGDPVNYKRP